MHSPAQPEKGQQILQNPTVYTKGRQAGIIITLITSIDQSQTNIKMLKTNQTQAAKLITVVIFQSKGRLIRCSSS